MATREAQTEMMAKALAKIVTDFGIIKALGDGCYTFSIDFVVECGGNCMTYANPEIIQREEPKPPPHRTFMVPI